MNALPAIAAAALCLLALPACRTRARLADGTEIVLGGRADQVSLTTPGGGSLSITGLSHAEETLAAGEMGERIATPIARAATRMKVADALEGVARAAFERAEAGDRIAAGVETTDAELDAMVRAEEIRATTATQPQ